MPIAWRRTGKTILSQITDSFTRCASIGSRRIVACLVLFGVRFVHSLIASLPFAFVAGLAVAARCCFRVRRPPRLHVSTAAPHRSCTAPTRPVDTDQRPHTLLSRRQQIGRCERRETDDDDTRNAQQHQQGGPACQRRGDRRHWRDRGTCSRCALLSEAENATAQCSETSQTSWSCVGLSN